MYAVTLFALIIFGFLLPSEETEINKVKISQTSRGLSVKVDEGHSYVFCFPVWVRVDIDQKDCSWTRDCLKSKAYERASEIAEKKGLNEDPSSRVFASGIKVKNGFPLVKCCRSENYVFTDCFKRYFTERKRDGWKDLKVRNGTILVNQLYNNTNPYRTLTLRECKIQRVDQVAYCHDWEKEGNKVDPGKNGDPARSAPLKQPVNNQVAPKTTSVGNGGDFGAGVLTGLGIGLPLLLLLITSSTTTLATTTTTTTTGLPCTLPLDITLGGGRGLTRQLVPALEDIKILDGETETLKCKNGEDYEIFQIIAGDFDGVPDLSEHDIKCNNGVIEVNIVKNQKLTTSDYIDAIQC